MENSTTNQIGFEIWNHLLHKGSHNETERRFQWQGDMKQFENDYMMSKEHTW